MSSDLQNTTNTHERRSIAGSQRGMNETQRLLASVLATGYLRWLSTRIPSTRNPACTPSVAVDPKRRNSLDVVARQSDELGGQRPDRRSQCKP
jgi:hypothetical protein